MAGRKAHHHSHNGSVFSAIWDKLGILASGLCLIDCIVLPLVSTALLSFQSTFAWAEKLHWLLLPVIGLTAGMAFYHSWKAHRSYFIVAAGLTGFLLLLAGEIFEAKLRFLKLNWVSVAGSAFLIGAHVRNLVMHLSHRHICTVDHAGHGRSHFGRRAPHSEAALNPPAVTASAQAHPCA
ncbi:MAG: MerC domain-containing protein [Turneriella sp.]|nr:MerC domain-containing protein [Turneriella sp.]